jgi:hypothetical protein
MLTTAPDRATAPEPMSADMAARVTAFARACKAAVRTVALYPGEHPAVGTALAAVTAAAEEATANALLQLAVRPDALTVEGRAIPRPDAAVADLAGILHRHQVGQITIRPLTDAETWRRFLALLSLPADQARLRGGLGELWASEGETRIEVRTLDYNELLRARVRGDKATWDAIVAGCLEGVAFSLDDAMVELLFGILNDPDKIVGLMQAVETRLASEHGEGRSPMVIAGLLQAVAQFVAASAPDEADRVIAALAEAATRLPVSTLAPMVGSQRGGTFQPGLARFIQGLVRHVHDDSIANLVASEVRSGRGSSTHLADAFCGLAPDPDRRSAILAQARNDVVGDGATANPALARAWQESEEMLITYSDKAFVSDAYHAEISNLDSRAVDLEKDHTDPAGALAGWRDSVNDDRIRLLDADLIADLMHLQQDVGEWRALAALAHHRVSVLLVVGDFAAAALLAEALRDQAEDVTRPEIKAAAAEALHGILTASTMRHVASHLDTSDREVVAAALRFCLALGTVAIGPLAEVLSREERSRPRKHLIDILIGFGAAGRQSVEKLRQSSNAGVRRTAVLLLREFGGQEALPELASLLDDDEPHVQREATRAIAMLGIDTAYDTLINALARGTDRARVSILGVLWNMPDEDAEPLLTYLVLHAPYRGAMWAVHERAVERLGTLGGQHVVSALATVLQRRSVWAPFRMVALHRRAIDALGRIGTPDAVDIIEATAASGLLLDRKYARVRLADLEGAAPGEGHRR